MKDYTVELDQLFRGPADLLLQLVKDEEVDVKDVSIARVCEGFLQHLKELSSRDLDVAADFLVVAANLMWLKSNSILPHDEIDLDEELGGKDDLLERLLEYRRFRAASQELGELKKLREQKFSRGFREKFESAEEEPDLDLEDLTSWDLLETYAKILKETLLDRPHVFKGDPKPVRIYAREMFYKIKDKGATTFANLFAEAKKKEDLIGYFVALLELVKQGIIGAEQKESFGEIDLVLKEDDIELLNSAFFTGAPGEEKDPIEKGESSNG